MAPSRLIPRDQFTPGRFGWVAAGLTSGPDSSFDIDLGGYANAAVIPTRGAIIPEWLMVVPRAHCLSLATLSAQDRRIILGYASEVRTQVSAIAGHAVYFEHGAAMPGSKAACGVDQAHLHVVGISDGFAEFVLRNSDNLVWTSADPSDPWEGMVLRTDYFILVSGPCAYKAFPKNPTSQFMRQQIARYLNRASEWDYRKYAHVENAAKTIATFKQGFKAGVDAASAIRSESI